MIGLLSLVRKLIPWKWPGPRVGPGPAARRLARQWFDQDLGESVSPIEFQDAEPSRPRDFLICVNQPMPDPVDIFRRLRWGGQLILIEPDQDLIMHAARLFRAYEGLDVEAGPRSYHRELFGLAIPGIGRRGFFVVLRKVSLLEAGEDTDRFTFDVRLVKRPEFGDRYVVMKQVPRYRRVVTRLQARFPEARQEVLLQRAEKLVKRVFPVFLTREAGFLQVMQRDMPEGYRDRVPEALGFERAPDGTVKRLYMSWLRLGGEPLSHLDFAKESAELLSVLHDRVGIIHLDLRLDNIVISRGRVCFIDFGSSVRVGEQIEKSPLLSSLFEEMLNTSQIQRTMGKMRDSGRLTSDVIVSAHGKIDKAVDMFYLSLQISRPVSNPELLPLIQYKPEAPVARRIKLLTSAILRPSNPNRPHFISARDVLGGLQRIERVLLESGELDRD